jgi:hypothetical protein
MLEQFLTFITPGPLTEKFGFQTRVFTSWICLGLVLGLIFSIFLASSGAAAPNGAVDLVLQSLIGVPLVVCFCGLVGLVFNSLRGGEAEYYGWYWWIFPILTYIAIGFWVTVLLLGFCLGLAGMSLPSVPRRTNGRRVIKSNFNKTYQEIQKEQANKFLDKHERLLKQRQQEEMERVQREPIDEKQKQEILNSLSIRDQIIIKIRENPGALLEDILTEDEMEELVFMILEAFL